MSLHFTSIRCTQTLCQFSPDHVHAAEEFKWSVAGSVGPFPHCKIGQLPRRRSLTGHSHYASISEESIARFLERRDTLKNKKAEVERAAKQDRHMLWAKGKRYNN